MGNPVVPPFFLSLFLFSLFYTPIQAIKKSYIVYLGSHSYGPNPSQFEVESVTFSHYDLLGSYLGSNEKAKNAIFYSYTRHINGFAAILEDEEAAQIAKNPNVVSVFLNKGKKLHTTHSWEFLGVEEDGGVIPSDSIWKKARFGEDIIIGNLDTGAWPESKSFNDEGMGPIPSKWRGICQHNNQDGVRCNKKLIGARYFNKGYRAYLETGNATISPALNATFFSARDHDGHGSHTLSTAGGSFAPGASYLGNGNGTAKGGSPKARVAIYKVCWPPVDGNECFDADILAGFDAAISDGVDVISISLGGPPGEFFDDGISIGSFHAVKNNIVAVASGGNDGPGNGTVSNVSPWIVTVGASTIDRGFTSNVSLGNKIHIEGPSLAAGGLPLQKFYPLISGADAKFAKANATAALLCKSDTLDRKKVKGKILVCLRGENDRLEKSYQASLAGAVGMILANDESTGNDTVPDPHFIPSTHISFIDGKHVFAYINSTKKPVAYMTQSRTVLGLKPSPSMASFSSRGPNAIEESILKPDITAPGVNIIAAYSGDAAPSTEVFDKRRVPYITLSGTSMSCPHVAGLVGLLKTLYPDWSPAAIKSAIMTTARTRDNSKNPILDSTMLKATPFAYGAGHIQPNQAMDPGLVYDLTANDYLNFLCGHGYNETQMKVFSDKPYQCPKSFSLTDFNYPSIVVPNLTEESVVVTRTVKNVGTPGTYKANLKAPAGVSVVVEPESLTFKKIGEEQKFKVVLKPKFNGGPENYEFGELRWSDGKHTVRSPIVAKHYKKKVAA